MNETQRWPENDERINAIGVNGNTGEHYDEVLHNCIKTVEMLKTLDTEAKIHEARLMHYDEQRDQHEQAQPEAPQANKYDRTIIGKYGSGKCTVDVYRVLNAFPSGSPEIDHALKKLLAPGKRGVKSELQDLREAIQSIEARIDYLKELTK
jgi:hypothetical protein